MPPLSPSRPRPRPSSPDRWDWKSQTAEAAPKRPPSAAPPPRGARAGQVVLGGSFNQEAAVWTSLHTLDHRNAAHCTRPGNVISDRNHVFWICCSVPILILKCWYSTVLFKSKVYRGREKQPHVPISNSASSVVHYCYTMNTVP
jgi:hypothetical protein